jgi:hypothetical protein
MTAEARRIRERDRAAAPGWIPGSSGERAILPGPDRPTARLGRGDLARPMNSGLSGFGRLRS